MLKERSDHRIDDPEERNHYATDDPVALYNLVCETEEAVLEASSDYAMRQYVRNLCYSEYRDQKSKLLLAMRRQESRPEIKKRTKEEREATYRWKLRQEHLAADIAEGDMWAAKEHLETLRKVLESRRDRLRFLAYERAGIKQGA